MTYVSHNAALLAHFRSGGCITPASAMELYGIGRLAARIHELRKKGHRITRQISTDDEGCIITEYRLAAQ